MPTTQETFTASASFPLANTPVSFAEFNPTNNIQRVAVAVTFTDTVASEFKLRLYGKLIAGGAGRQLLIDENQMGSFIMKGRMYPLRPGTHVLQINLEVDEKIAGIWDVFQFEGISSSNGSSAALTIVV